MTGPVRRSGVPAGPGAKHITCPSCGGQVVAGLPFCPTCGERLTEATEGRSCPRCGTAAPDETKYCPACGLGLDGAVRPSAAATSSTSPFVISVIDQSGDVLSRHPLSIGESTIGRDGADMEFSDDQFMSPLHVKLTVEGDELDIRDLGSRNGTWVFISEPHRLVDGDRVLLGSQVLEYRRLGYPGPNPPERDQTRRLGSLVPSADIARLTQLRSDGSERDTMHLSPGRDLTLGREQGDWIFPYDPSMSSQHAEIRSEDADFVLIDTGSRNGVAVAARGDVPTPVGTRLLVGDKMLRIDQA